MTGPALGGSRGRGAAKKAAVISLGCAKNLVDSEIMLGALKKDGFVLTNLSEDADVVIVNTCGFIAGARAEAETALRAALRAKAKDPRKRIVAAGCYVERDRARLVKRFPQVDAWTGVRSFDRIAEIVREGRSRRPARRTFLYSDRSPRLVSTPPAWAYVKISEGCSHRCSFCAIPLIKGPYRSRRPESVLREVRALADHGVREVNLISHDTTWYGRDLGLRDGLASLLERLTRVSGVEWLRFLYGYPEEISDRLLEVMAEPKICRYLDIPFQHADARLIKLMRRGLDGEGALLLLDKIRARLPDAAVRTSLIVGFPGEGPREFGRLRDFVRRARFDHLGVFAYSPEDGTPAFRLPDTVDRTVKEGRRRDLMALQAEVALAKNRSRVGREFEVLVERCGPGPRPRCRGRGRFQAPEVDGLVRFRMPEGAAPPSDPLVRVRITSAGPYDLEGRLAA